MTDKNLKRQAYRKQKKKRTFSFTNIIGVLLILVAIGLFAMDPIKNYLIEKGQTTNQVSNLTREQIAQNESADVAFDFDVIEQLDAYSVISGGVNPENLPTIGGVSIPSVEMNLPIYKGVSNEGMYLGAGTLKPNIVMGANNNYSIASHHSIHQGLLFEPLARVKEGDAVYLTNLEEVYKYEVYAIYEVTPDRMDVLDDTGEPIVTLLTCDVSGANRVIVQAKLVETKPIQEASQDMVAAFQLDQTVHMN